MYVFKKVQKMCIFGVGALQHTCSYLQMVGIDKMTVSSPDFTDG